MVSGMDELKRRLEVLLGAKSEATADQSTIPPIQPTIDPTARKKQLADASGQLVTSALVLLGNSLGLSSSSEEQVERIKQNLLQCVETDDHGHSKLTLNLPTADSLQQIAQALAQLMQPVERGL
jgi:hypothetical protein